MTSERLAGQEELKELPSTRNFCSILALSHQPPSAVSPEAVITRVMSFDRNSDGKVTIDELPERMQPLVARGDCSGDGALSASEVTMLVSAPQVFTASQNAQSRYGFADAVEHSSRRHIEGSIDDLRLTVQTSFWAKTIALAFADEFEGAAHANLRSAVAPLVPAELLTAFEHDLKRVAGFVAEKEKALDPWTGPFNRYRLSAEQMNIVKSVIETFSTDVELNDARRAEISARLAGVLTNEERDNLRAALARHAFVRGPGSGGSRIISSAGFILTPAEP